MSTYYQDAFDELKDIVQRSQRSEAVNRLLNELCPFPVTLDVADANGGHWCEHPRFTSDDWRYLVAARETRSSYWDWVVTRLEEEAEEDEAA